jgi:hypothetical protein
MPGGRPQGSKEGAGVKYSVTGYDLFDYDRFLVDVHASLKRDKISCTDLCRAYGMAANTLNSSRAPRRVAFRTVCFFASFCDISLDGYLVDVLAAEGDIVPTPPKPEPSLPRAWAEHRAQMARRGTD